MFACTTDYITDPYYPIFFFLTESPKMITISKTIPNSVAAGVLLSSVLRGIAILRATFSSPNFNNRTEWNCPRLQSSRLGCECYSDYRPDAVEQEE